MKKLSPWDRLLKEMLWQQLAFVQDMEVLDFGSGEGVTAAHMASHNRVTAVEPSPEMLAYRDTDGDYTQLEGDVARVNAMPESSFDAVLCHNVLEYVEDKPAVLRALCRVLRPGGILSLCKHNRAGRVMQMAVLMDDQAADMALLDGGDGMSAQFGPIRYYEDGDVLGWCPELRLEQCYGLRTFWDLQQRQELHADPAWQERMLALEGRVSQVDSFRQIAFFHHLILRKEG